MKNKKDIKQVIFLGVVVFSITYGAELLKEAGGMVGSLIDSRQPMGTGLRLSARTLSHKF